MKKIVGVFKPFNLKQNLYVFEDGNKITSVEVTLEDAAKTIMALAKEYDTNQIDLSGPKQYVRGLKKHFEQKELEKYNQNKLTFNII